MGKREAGRTGPPRGRAKAEAPRAAPPARTRRPKAAASVGRARAAAVPRTRGKTRLRPEDFREHLFRLDRLIDEVAAGAGLVLGEPDRAERVEGLVEGALETWAELARQAEKALARSSSLAGFAENLGVDPVVRARTAALLRQAGRSWLQPQARGIERVPRRGPVVLAVRRLGEASGWDAIALRLLLEDDPPSRPGVGLLVAAGRLDSPVVGLALERTGGGAIDRGEAARMLRDGGAVVAFVEGRRLPRAPRARGAPALDERAVVRLALATRASVVPVLVSGGAAGGLLARLSPIARGGRIDLAFGSPLARGARRGAEAPRQEASVVARLARELRDRLDDLAPEEDFPGA